MEKVICGIQQIGIGVKNVEEYWKWYKENLGFDAKIFSDEGVAERMLPYTGGKPQPRYAILALNLSGGGGFEIWEPRGRELNYIKNEPRIGDYGIFACKIKCYDINSTFKEFKKRGINVLCEPSINPAGVEHFFIKDPWGNLFDVEKDDYHFICEGKLTGGCNGVIMGVSNMEKSIEFYSTLLDYDHIVYDKTDIFTDYLEVRGCENRVRRVLLSRTKPIMGPLCEILGTSHIELVQAIDPETPSVKLYEGRLWGDPGFIHLCFDIRNMEAVHQSAKSLGHEFVCDSGADFDMGEANGHFTYVEDPDGALIEFVETFKVPVLKKLGIYLHLDKRDPHKPLPRFISRAFRFMRNK